MCLLAILCFEDLFSLVFSISSGSYHLSVSFSGRFSEHWGERLDRHIPIKPEYSKASYYLCTVWSLYLFPPTAGGIFSQDGRTRCLSIKSLGVIFFLYSLFRTEIFGFPLSQWSILSQNLAHPSSVGYVINLMEWALNPIRYWLVTSTSLVPLVSECIFHTAHHFRSKGLHLVWGLSFSSSNI